MGFYDCLVGKIYHFSGVLQDSRRKLLILPGVTLLCSALLLDPDSEPPPSFAAASTPRTVSSEVIELGEELLLVGFSFSLNRLRNRGGLKPLKKNPFFQRGGGKRFFQGGTYKSFLVDKTMVFEKPPYWRGVEVF